MRHADGVYAVDHPGLSVFTGVHFGAAELPKAAERRRRAGGPSADAGGRRERPSKADRTQHAAHRPRSPEIQDPRLHKAVRSYDMDTGTSLSTYAARCIENEILMSLRQSRKQQGDVSLDEPLGTDRDGNAVSFADLLGTSPDLVEEEVRRRITLSGVKRALPTLPPRERLVLSLRYGLKDGAVHPQHEIAKMLGISRSYVSRVEKHAVELLREALLSGEENP